jgi:hypothetical protein
MALLIFGRYTQFLFSFNFNEVFISLIVTRASGIIPADFVYEF